MHLHHQIQRQQQYRNELLSSTITKRRDWFIWCLDSDRFDENLQNLWLIASMLDRVSLAYVHLLNCYYYLQSCSFCSQVNRSLHLPELLTILSLSFLLLLALDTRSEVPTPEYKTYKTITTNKTEPEFCSDVIIRERERETAEFSHPWRDFQHKISFHEVLSHKLQIAANCWSIVEHLCT